MLSNGQSGGHVVWGASHIAEASGGDDVALKSQQ
jgi:hypothetical protein